MQSITSELIGRLKYSYSAHSFGSYISLRDCCDFCVTVLCVEDLANIPWVLQRSYWQKTVFQHACVTVKPVSYQRPEPNAVLARARLNHE